MRLKINTRINHATTEKRPGGWRVGRSHSSSSKVRSKKRSPFLSGTGTKLARSP